MTHENIEDKYTKEELAEALRPVSSIISKCEKAQLKFSFPLEFNRMVLYEMQNSPKRIKEMLAEARKSQLQIIDHILLIAIEKKEITKMPIVETKLALFQLLRHAIVLENEPVSAKKLETIVDFIVLPAILEGTE
ncbi:hypothetical protein Amet_3959 [Alkaliphilus metalliredigens QYMF]|uniref:Uncharacterized protein n=1 Tax=Alkaliphilus metalliredigens (strain QYMF) TaxID=293826 RepID=A6TV29_ALKMQ|nr:hypothetical protein [Alkaliphilus metalliredigens]ABR50047.1 hypothetical protein Amet_3959 [Alkaliphilus metalliredigens QYMF]